jgi:sugar phosphate isomerase/epimerase
MRDEAARPPILGECGAVTRRGLFQTAGIAVVGTLLGSPVGATDPPKRSGLQRMKLSLAAYSFRDYLQGKLQPNMTYPEFVDRAAAYPIDAVELTEYYFPKPLTDEFIAKIKRQCHLHGLDISGSPMGNVFTHPVGPARDKEIERVKAWIDKCALLGSPAIRIFAGNAQPGQSLADAQKATIECIEACADHCAQRGVMLALENHGGIVAEADSLITIIKGVKSEWCGINLDTGNFRTEDPYGDMAKCAPYAITAQVKTEITVKGQGKQQADLKREVQILKDAGYRGYVTLEYEAAEEPLKAVPRILEQMRALL